MIARAQRRQPSQDLLVMDVPAGTARLRAIFPGTGIAIVLIGGMTCLSARLTARCGLTDRL